jgi:hypothetical protein
MTREDAQKLLLMRLIAAGFIGILLLALVGIIVMAIYP